MTLWGPEMVVVLYLANLAYFTVRMRDFRRPDGVPCMMRLVVLGGLTTTVVTVYGVWTTPAPDWRQAVAVGVLPLSIVLFAWAMRSARAHGFGIAFSGVVPGTWITGGAYAWLLHPIYVAYSLTWAGGAVAADALTPWMMTVGMVLLYASAARQENRELRAVYGNRREALSIHRG